MIELSRDLSYIGSSKMEYQKLHGDVMSAKKREELIEICDWLVSEVSRGICKTEDTKDLSVLRTKSIIHEFYNTGITLDEIAERVGYNDSKYFSKVFREVTGQLPADYRKTAV